MCVFRRSIHALLTLSVIVFFPLVGQAEPDPAPPATQVSDEMMLFQEIPSVYGASKYEQKVTEAPSSVSIVTASEIKKYGYRTLADILRSVRSFYVTYDRNYSFVGVRGFGRPADYNNRILLLVDGHRTDDNLYDMAFIGTDAVLDVDLIDRVEIIRGPGSSLYGTNALFAVVNVITRRGRDLQALETSGEAASYDTYKGRLTYGDRYQNGFETIVSGTLYDSKGQKSLYFPEYDAPATNNGKTNNTDYDRFHSFFTKTSYKDFTFEAAYNSRTKGIPTGAFQTDFNNPDNKTTDTRGYLDLRYERAVGRNTDITARVFYDSYKYTGTYIISGTENRDWGYGEWWGGELKLSSRLFDVHRLILGTEYTYNNRLDQENYDVSPPSQRYLDDHRRSQIGAAYLQDEFTIIKNTLLLNAGVRYDHFDTFGGTTNPRVALIVTPQEKSTIKALYGTAFRAPSPFELYYQSPPTNASNPDLKPEKIKTYELVYEQYLADRFRATAAGFYYEITDLIDQTETQLGSGVSVFRNLGKVKSRGFELELENKWANGVEGRISYTLQRAINADTNELLSNSPEHLAKLALNVPVMQDRIFAGIEEHYMSKRKTLSGADTQDFYITNITLYTQRIVKNFELSASVYNLFDVKYGDPVSQDFAQQSIVQDGRTYRLKLTYVF